MPLLGQPTRLPSDSEETMPPEEDRCTDQEYFRWPPLGVTISGSGTRGALMTEPEKRPLPFLSRELRLEEAEWEHYRRKNLEYVQRQRAKAEAGKHSWKRSRHTDVEAFHPHRQKINRVSWQLPLHPLSTLAFAWRVLITFVDATYSAFLIPIACAFHWNSITFTWYNGLDIAAGVMFWLDIALGFSTGFVVIYNLKRVVVMSPPQIAEFYIMRGTFFYDIISALPVIAEVVVLCIPRLGGQTSLHVLYLLRLCRLVRVFKLVTWLIQVSLVGEFNKFTRKFMSAGQTFLVSLLYAGMVLLNLLTCLWVYVASWEGLENSWLQSVGPTNKDISGDGPVRAWVASFHFVTATVSTVGYGDIAPVSAAEELVAAFIMLAGLVVFGFIISGSQELVGYLAPQSRALGLLRRKMEQFEVWAEKRHISPRLAAHCSSYFTEVWLHSTELKTSTIFSELPALLQADICYELTRRIFESSDVFKDLDSRAHRLFAARLRPLSVAAGHDLCRQGETASCIWFLEEGDVISIRNGHQVEMRSHPAVLGEAAILASQIPTCRNHACTLRAVSPCMTWQLDEAGMHFIFGLHPEIMDQLLHSFKEYLQHHMQDDRQLYDEEGWDDVLDHIDNTHTAGDEEQRLVHGLSAGHSTERSASGGGREGASGGGNCREVGKAGGPDEEDAMREDKQESLVNRDDKDEYGLPQGEGGNMKNEGVGKMKPNGI